MKLLPLKLGAFAVAFGLLVAWSSVNSSSVGAQGMMAASPPPIACTEDWLKAAMGRLATAAKEMNYSGNLDKDAGAAMMMAKRSESQASAWLAQCGKNVKAKAMAAKLKAQSAQDMQALMVTTQSLP